MAKNRHAWTAQRAAPPFNSTVRNQNMKALILTIIVSGLTACSLIFDELNVTNLTNGEIIVKLNAGSEIALKIDESTQISIPYSDVVYLWVESKNIQCKIVMLSAKYGFKYNIMRIDSKKLIIKIAEGNGLIESNDCIGF